MDRATIQNPGEEITEDGMFANGQKPFNLDGTFYFPACDVRVATAFIGNDGTSLVQLDMVTRSMLGNHVGVFLRMTPEGARAIAGQLIADAQKVDNHVAAQAAAAIEAARQKGGPASSSGAVGPQGGL